MDVEPRVTREPAANSLCLVRPVVVHHEVDVKVLRHLLVHFSQEAEKLATSMSSMQPTDYLACGDIECCKQRRRSVPHVVVRAALGHPGGHRQDRLSAIQRLDLALLVYTEHNRFRRRIEVEADDVARLLDELRIRRELEGLLPMRLKAEGAPDTRNRRLRKLRLARHQPSRPVRRVRRWAFERSRNHGFHLLIADGSRCAGSRRVRKPFEPIADEASAPLRDGLRRDFQQSCDVLIAPPVGTCKHDPRSHREGLRRLSPASPLIELGSLIIRKRQLRLWSSSHECHPLRSLAAVSHARHDS